MGYFTKNVGKQSQFDNEEVIVRKIPLDQIRPDEDQVREIFDETKLTELADSIRERGIMNPIHVKKLDKIYIIITGERRFRAAKSVGLDVVPCIVHEEELSDKDIRALQLIENLQRSNLTGLEVAKGFESLKKQGLGQRKIAKSLGVSESLVSQGMTVVKKLPAEWIREIEENKANFSINDLYQIAKVTNTNKRIALFKQAMKAVEREVEITQPEPKKAKKTSKQELSEAQWKEVWEKLKIKVKRDKQLLAYYLKPQSITELLNVQEESHHSDNKR